VSESHSSAHERADYNSDQVKFAAHMEELYEWRNGGARSPVVRLWFRALVGSSQRYRCTVRRQLIKRRQLGLAQAEAKEPEEANAKSSESAARQRATHPGSL
jgi:hypothetical protein